MLRANAVRIISQQWRDVQCLAALDHGAEILHYGDSAIAFWSEGIPSLAPVAASARRFVVGPELLAHLRSETLANELESQEICDIQDRIELEA